MEHVTLLPHGVCYLWRSDLIWLHVLGDAGIALAYLLIPLLLWVTLRTLAPTMVWELVHTMWWFIAFILMCAATHAVNIWMIWEPSYYIQGFVKLAAASVSFGAVINLASTTLRISRAFMTALKADERARLQDAVLDAIRRVS